MVTMIRNVYHTYSQARTAIIPEAITKSCSSYNLIWICAKTFLQSEVFLNGSMPADVVNAPSVNAFKIRLDKFWLNQEVRFNYKSRLLSYRQLSCSHLDTRAAWPSSSTCLRLRFQTCALCNSRRSIES